jgi:maltose O-acetyltransferase
LPDVDEEQGNGNTVQSLEELMEQYPDVYKQFTEQPNQYRKSEILPKITWETQAICHKINEIFYDDFDEAMRLFHEMIPGAGEGIDFRPPFSIDYGIGLVIGDRTFINKNFLICGGAKITIGHDCLIGPRCTISVPNHSIDPAERLEGWEVSTPVTIGNNVWLGSNVTILPGVTIGDNSIIGAGSVVVKDIPNNVIAVGNPCKPIREI